MGMHKLEYCKKGLHLLRGLNAAPKADGTRACRICRAETRRKLRKVKKEEAERIRKLIDEVARY